MTTFRKNFVEILLDDLNKAYIEYRNKKLEEIYVKCTDPKFNREESMENLKLYKMAETVSKDIILNIINKYK